MLTSHVTDRDGKSSTRRRMAILSLVSASAMLLAGCGGSALQPDEVLEANSRVRGIAADGTGETGTGAPGTSDGTPVSGTAVDGTGGQIVDPAAPGGAAGQPSGGTGGSGTAGSPVQSGGGTIKVKAGSCNGFKNGPGITDTTISIGNAADTSGPVPGLFVAAQQATKAYLAYFNSKNPQGICGRKLVMNTYDTRTDAGANLVAFEKMCSRDFASIGSMSAFDSGAASVAEGCKLPSLHAAAVTSEFNRCSTCFGVDATGLGEFSNEAYDFWVRNEKAATQKAAFLYINAGAAAENAKTQIAVGKKRGINWIYTTPIDVADFNYGPYVQQMKSKGVEMVQFLGAWQMEVRFLRALQAANYKPKVRMFDPSAYEEGFFAQGGSATDGVFMYLINTPFDERQAELDLYKQWLGQVAPGAKPTFFGTFSWSAAKLFVEQALKLGGKLNRATLVQSVKGIHDWVGGGMHGPMDVGGKHPASCLRYLVAQNGKWVPYKGTKYRCSGYSKS